MYDAVLIAVDDEIFRGRPTRQLLQAMQRRETLVFLLRVGVRTTHKLPDGVVDPVRSLRHTPPIRQTIDAVNADNGANLRRRLLIERKHCAHMRSRRVADCSDTRGV